MLPTTEPNEKLQEHHFQNEWKMLILIKKLIFSLNEENITQTAQAIIDKFDNNHPISFNLIIIQMINIMLILKNNNFDIYSKFLKEIKMFEDKTKIYDLINCLILDNFVRVKYLIYKLLEYNFIELDTIKKFCDISCDPYFIQYLSEKETENLDLSDLINQTKYSYFKENFGQLPKNYWELHKKYVKEGHN